MKKVQCCLGTECYKIKNDTSDETLNCVNTFGHVGEAETTNGPCFLEWTPGLLMNVPYHV